MNRADAEKVNALMSELFGRINQILLVVNNSGDVGLRKSTQLALGKVTAELDLEILEPIYKQFPDLRPPELEEVSSKPCRQDGR